MDAINIAFLDQIARSVGTYIPNIVGALFILVVGWFVALFIAALVQGLLRTTKFDNQVAKWAVGEEGAKSFNVERLVGKIVFYFLLLFVLVAFFRALNLEVVAEPLSQLLNEVFAYLPRVFGAALLLLAAWIIANISKLVILRALSIAKIDKRLESAAGIHEGKEATLTHTLAEAVYWVIFLLFLPAILDVLRIQGLLGPVQDMTNQVLNFMPNIFAAVLLLLVGWIGARIVQRIVTNLLGAAGIDRLSESVGIAPVLGSQKLSHAIGVVVYILVLIPVLIASLNVLALDAITGPASNMLSTILGAIPALFAALLVLGFSYAVGRVVAGLVSNLLTSVGFNALFAKLGVDIKTKNKQAPSLFVGYLVLAGIMLFAFIEAFRFLGMEVVANLTAQFVVFASHIVFGLVILAIGLYIANIASSAIEAGGGRRSGLLATVARAAILLLAGAMALRQMGVANEIITLGFGLILGSVAVALAIALGLGGREVAAREIDDWVRTIKRKR